MPKTCVVIYQERNGTVPLLDWLEDIPTGAQDACIARVELLAERVCDLRRPHCENLGYDIWELRARVLNVHYRILYAFVGQHAVLLSHGFIKKKRKVQKIEIQRAVDNLNKYRQEPKAHTYVGRFDYGKKKTNDK